MKNPIKPSGRLVLEIFAFWIGSRILDHYYPQFRNTIFNLHVDPLFLISDIVFAGSIISVVFFWLRDKFGWFKNKDSEAKSSDYELQGKIKHIEKTTLIETLSSPPFRDKDSRTKYHVHLIRDICQVVEKQMQLEKLSETNALFRLPAEKQNLIMSHFFTAEYDSDKYDGLYTTYRSLLEFERSVITQSKKVYDYLDEIEKYLLRLHHDNYSTTKYTLNDFFLSLGISNKTELLDFYRIEDTYQKLMGYRQIINSQEGDQFIVRINRKDVFKSSSWDISHKCEQMLIQKFEKFEDPFTEAWYSTKYEVYDRLAKYNTTIRNNFEFIRNVEPIIGCCAGCLQYFMGNQKSKFEKLLAQFETEEKPKLAKI